MCITAPARVLSVDPTGAMVELAGRRRRASTLALPDVVAGDWVLIGAGSILRRLEPEEALDLVRTIRSAIAASDARPAAQGGPR